MNILVSACLLGEPCRYDGASKPHIGIIALSASGHTLVPICPEVMGGLPTPRPPAEVVGNAVRTASGADVTAEYRAGASDAVALAKQMGCTVAILKENSPSCGSRERYDGTFSRHLVSGMGVAAQALHDAGVRVLGESELEQLLCETLFST